MRRSALTDNYIFYRSSHSIIKIKMQIHWIVDGITKDSKHEFLSNIASHRYRCILPASGLKQLGFNIRFINSSEWLRHPPPLPQAVIVAKQLPINQDLPLFIEKTNKLLNQIKVVQQQGIPVFADVNDDHFSSPHQGIANYWQNLVKVVDSIIVGSTFMAERVRQFTNTPITVIGDPLESPRGEIKIFNKLSKVQSILQNTLLPKGWLQQRLVIAWYGNSVNWHDLQNALPSISTLGRQQPFTLKIITTPTRDIQTYVNGYNAQDNPASRLELLPWNQDTVWQDVSDAHLVIIPSNINDNKKIVKTANRLIEALNLGRFVIANPVPAYLEYQNYAWVGDNLLDGIEWAISNPQQVEQKVRDGQTLIAPKNSVQAISLIWQTTLEKLI